MWNRELDNEIRVALLGWVRVFQANGEIRNPVVLGAVSTRKGSRRLNMFDKPLIVEDWLRVKRQELLREAELDRLARQSSTMRGQHTYPVRLFLSWLGRHLESWGQRLQDRYGTPREAPTFGMADRTR